MRWRARCSDELAELVGEVFLSDLDAGMSGLVEGRAGVVAVVAALDELSEVLERGGDGSGGELGVGAAEGPVDFVPMPPDAVLIALRTAVATDAMFMVSGRVRLVPMGPKPLVLMVAVLSRIWDSAVPTAVAFVAVSAMRAGMAVHCRDLMRLTTRVAVLTSPEAAAATCGPPSQNSCVVRALANAIPRDARLGISLGSLTN